MNKNKGFIGIGLILAIVLGVVVVGGGAYYMGTKKDNPKQEVDKLSEVSEINKEVGQEVSKTQNQDTKLIDQTKTVVDNSSANCKSNSVPSIKVLSPNGGEVYKAGDKITVKWESCNITSTALNIFVALHKDGGWDSVTYLSNATTNNGNEVFTIPANIMLGSYKIRVGSVSAKVQQDFSDNSFTINSPQVSMANWKTYTNKEYGFSFNYPETWSMVGQPSNNINLKGEITGQEVNFNDINTNTILNVHYYLAPSGKEVFNLTLSDFNSGLYKDAKEIKVDGNNGIKYFTTKSIDIKGNVYNPPMKEVFVNFLDTKQTGSMVLFLETILPNSVTEIANFEKLLTTFKFL